MSLHHHKQGVESAVAQQMEEWAIKFQNHYDEKIHAVQQEQKETLAIVNRLGKYVNNLEFKVNTLSNNMKSMRNGDVELDFPEIDHHSPMKPDNSGDLNNRLSMLEKFCGYDPEREAYAALGLGTGDLLLPEHKLSTRLDKVEKEINKLDRNIRQVEYEVGDLYNHGNGNGNNKIISSGSPLNGPLANGLFFPESARPKSTHGDSRHRPVVRQERGDVSATPHGPSTPFSTPHPPHNGSFGYRSAPKSRQASRPLSAPNTNTTPAQNRGQQLQKAMEDIRSQMEEMTEKNNMQNSFLMNELRDSVGVQDGKMERKIKGIQAFMTEQVGQVEVRLKRSVQDVKADLHGKITCMEADIEQLHRKDKDLEEKYDLQSMQQLAAQQVGEGSTPDQQQDFDALLEQKEIVHLQQQREFQNKEIDLQRELQKREAELRQKDSELREVLSKNSTTQEAYVSLQEEARALRAGKARLEEEHTLHVQQLQAEFEERSALVDERTELFRAESKRLKELHQELQEQVNAEIRARTGQLESEKQQLEQQLTEEMSLHNLQAEKDRIIKDSLQSDIDMFKKSCSQAHQDKDLVLAKLRDAEAKFSDLEAQQLKSSVSHSPQRLATDHLEKPPDLKVQVSSLSAMSATEGEGEGEERDRDHFAFETPKLKALPGPASRRASFGRADTPIPSRQKNIFLPRSSSNSEKSKPESFVLSPDTAVKKQQSLRSVNSPLQEAAENSNSNINQLVGVDSLGDEKLQEMVQDRLSQEEIEDAVILRELVKEKEQELEKATAAKAQAKKKIKNWMRSFEKTHQRPPNQNEKLEVSELYVDHQLLAEAREELMETLQELKGQLDEKVYKVVT